jgi:competence protein ComEC
MVNEMKLVRRLSTAMIAAAAVVAVIWFTARPPQVTVDFLDVGQGDAMLIRSGGEEVLIDGGPDRSVLSELGRTMPFFDRSIEYVVLTHPHADHIRGLLAVLERYRVGRLILTSAAAGAGETAPLLRAARAAGVRITEAGAGDVVRLTNAELDVLWPLPGRPPPSRRAGDSEVNDDSLVIRLTAFCDHPADGAAPSCPGVMFAGDASAGVERELIGGGRTLRAQVLKVGHHGSNYSTSSAWLATVSPSTAVIEVGENGYGHPSFALLRRLQASRVDVRRTDLDGGIRAILTAQGVRWSRPLSSRFH